MYAIANKMPVNCGRGIVRVDSDLSRSDVLRLKESPPPTAISSREGDFFAILEITSECCIVYAIEEKLGKAYQFHATDKQNDYLVYRFARDFFDSLKKFNALANNPVEGG